MIRRLFPKRVRAILRHSFDCCFCRRSLGLDKLGASSTWTVINSRIVPGTKVLSGGAGRDISFELELAARRGCEVVLFDPSPTGMETITAFGTLPEGLTFSPFGLAGRSARVAFARPDDELEGSFQIANSSAIGSSVEFDCLSLDEAFRQTGWKELELLKLDIEGFEYEVLKAMLQNGIRPMQIAVEFHHFLPGIPLSRTIAILWRLWSAGYRVVHKEQCDFLLVHRTALIECN